MYKMCFAIIASKGNLTIRIEDSKDPQVTVHPLVKGCIIGFMRAKANHFPRQVA